jgi:hypothetical protein
MGGAPSQPPPPQLVGQWEGQTKVGHMRLVIGPDGHIFVRACGLYLLALLPFQ